MSTGTCPLGEVSKIGSHKSRPVRTCPITYRMDSAVAWEEAQVRPRHVAPSTHHRFANLITRNGGVEPTIRFVLGGLHDVVHHHVLRIIGCAGDESRRSRYVKTAASAAAVYRRIHIALYWSIVPSVAPDIVGYQSTCRLFFFFQSLGTWMESRTSSCAEKNSSVCETAGWKKIRGKGKAAERGKRWISMTESESGDRTMAHRNRV